VFQSRFIKTFCSTIVRLKCLKKRIPWSESTTSHSLARIDWRCAEIIVWGTCGACNTWKRGRRYSCSVSFRSIKREEVRSGYRWNAPGQAR